MEQRKSKRSMLLGYGFETGQRSSVIGKVVEHRAYHPFLLQEQIDKKEENGAERRI